MTRTHRAVVVTTLLVGGLAGCGSSSRVGAGSSATTGRTTATATATTTVSTTSATTVSSSSAPISTPTVSGNPVVPTDFCFFLYDEVATLPAAGSQAGALAQFAGDLSGWIERHPAQKPRTAADLDDAARTCPDAATAVVSNFGKASFTAALG